MKTEVLTFPMFGKVVGQVKYLQLEGDVYLVVLEGQVRHTDWGSAINAIFEAERLSHSACRVFLISTHKAYPEVFSPGNFSTMRVSRLGDDQDSGYSFAPAACPEDVQAAFQEQIGEAAE